MNNEKMATVIIRRKNDDDTNHRYILGNIHAMN